MKGDDSSIDWRPASIAEVKQILMQDLADCNAEQNAVFHRYAVEPYIASLVRYGQPEGVIVVARKKDEVIYWEDVEEASTSRRLMRPVRSLNTGATRINSATQ